MYTERIQTLRNYDLTSRSALSRADGDGTEDGLALQNTFLAAITMEGSV